MYMLLLVIHMSLPGTYFNVTVILIFLIYERGDKFLTSNNSTDDKSVIFFSIVLPENRVRHFRRQVA